MVNRPLTIQIDWNAVFSSMIAMTFVIAMARVCVRILETPEERLARLPQAVAKLRFATTMLEVDRDMFAKWVETEKIQLFQAGGRYRDGRKPTLAVLDDKIYAVIPYFKIIKLLSVRWEDLAEETVREVEEQGVKIAGVALLPQVKRKQVAPYTYKATVECPICEEGIEVSGYGAINRTGILKRHIMRKHFPKPLSSCPLSCPCLLSQHTGACPAVASGNPVRVGYPPATELMPELQPVRRRGPLITEEEVKLIHELRAQGLTIPQIAERMKRAVSVVKRHLYHGYAPLHQTITTKRIDEALQLRRKGLKQEEIGKLWGVTRQQVSRLLHWRDPKIAEITETEAQRIERVEATKSLNEALLGVSDGLKRPDTLLQLTAAANRLRDIGNSTLSLLEITPVEYQYDLGFIHHRSHRAEETLLTGVWCFEEKPKWEHLVEMQKKERKPYEEALGWALHFARCAEVARDIARGFIEGWADYETRAEIVEREIEEMMKAEIRPYRARLF